MRMYRFFYASDELLVVGEKLLSPYLQVRNVRQSVF